MFIFLTIIGLSLLILIHEFGHFITAKLFGLRVDEFGFGLPPRAWGKKIGETIYSLNWLPFGGFVKIYGEDTAGETLTMRKTPMDANNANNSHELENSHRLDVNQDRDKRSFATQPPWKRSVIILAGVIMNFIFGWLLISTVFLIGNEAGIYVSKISEGGPAEISGMKLGDRILGYNSGDEFITYIKEHRGKEITLNVMRGDKEQKISAVPRENPPPGEGSLGIALNEEKGGHLGLFPALYQGLITTAQLIGLIAIAIVNLIGGLFTQSADLKDVTGPIGIFKIAEGAGALGITSFLGFFALISINLGVINAFPFPALDGGRFLFIIIEKIKGSPLPVKFERIANGIGFALLISLMILITIRDIRNIVM